MFQLVIHYRISTFSCLNSQRLGDVESLMEEHLQRELNSPILGLAHTTMRQFLNQFRLAFRLRNCYEIKCSVLHLLSHAMTAELGLGAPEIPWHTSRDGLAELGGWLSLVTGAMGKMGADLVLIPGYFYMRKKLLSGRLDQGDVQSAV